ncbi:MAG: hypothetical protein A4E58_02067 [Syntrophorhabdus sp. PtaB.Bin006]|nr:MAG: hypothetical protein A4E58_02067 [Syntrophorhabdus sp. PtaB.Bin006]
MPNLRIFRYLLLGVCSFLIALFTGHAAASGVDSFTPEGTVKDVRQVTARFSDQMVAFGDPRLSDPFDIQCPEKGKGRWVDGKNWSYDFDRDLPAGMVCTFTVKPALKTLSGKALTGLKRFSFSTGGPSIIQSDPYEGDEYIDENQRFIFVLDSEADEKSLLQHVYCSVEGIKERVGIRLVTGKDKDDFFKAIKRGKDKRPNVVVECRRTFPPRSQVTIVWGKGVKSLSGVATREDQTMAYKTRKPFSGEFRCMKENPKAGCMPLSPMHLSFSAPVPWVLAREITLKSDKSQVWKPAKIEEGHGTAYLVVPGKAFVVKDNNEDNFVTGISFEGPFPDNTGFTITIPKEFRDDAGRKLTNQDSFPLKTRTHSYPPLAKFSSHFGILEDARGALLPVTVRNLETEIKTWVSTPDTRGKDKVVPIGQTEPGKDQGLEIVQDVKGRINRFETDNQEVIIEWLKRLRRIDRRVSILKGTGQEETLTIAKPGPSKEFEVIGIPLKGPGFSVVELESRLLGSRLLSKPGPMYVPTSALVTNMVVHFKWGRKSSLAWVTSLDRGEPVKDAAVTLRDCSGKIIWQGTTDEQGLAKIPDTLPLREKLSSCPLERTPDRDSGYDYEGSPVLNGIGSGLFVFARKGPDMTFTHSSWSEGIDPWRFNLRTDHDPAEDNDYIAHTVFDRMLFRAGDTVSMKHFVRRKDMVRGFTFPPQSILPDEIVIRHTGSDQRYTFPLKWHENGAAETTWKIPQNANLGTYAVHLERKAGKKEYRETGWNTGSFQVEEFRVPLMRAVVKGPKDPVIKAKDVDVDISLAYLSGGGASFAPVKLRSEVRPKALMFPDYEEFTFSRGYARKDEIETPYREEDGEYEDGIPVIERRHGRDGKDVQLKTLELTLDGTGSARTKLAGLPEVDTPRDILAELEFRDPNGETQTVSSRIGIYPAKIHAGIVLDKTGTGDDALRYKVIAVDLKGRPVADTPAKVTLLKRNTYSHRRRIAGGFYAYESTSEIVEVGPHCQGKTGKEGILFCEGKSPVEGDIIFQAEAWDDGGNVSASYVEDYIYGKEDQWFESGNDDRFDLIPEKKRYEPGEPARFQVRMPFKEATVLVSVEREGIMETYVQKVSRRKPVVEIPIKSHYAPNVYISALVVRGRIGDAKPTATFDPGKPAYKLGIAEIKVGWQAHELKVALTTDRKTYKVRETVEAKIIARTALGKVPPKGSEVIVAAIDEGLLELKENSSWKLLEAMMAQRAYEVNTSTAQTMVIGKRHFGRKAFPHGGGGGKQTTRELFDTLLFWKSTVKLDDNGETTVKIPLNDSLTSFRIVAIATGGDSLFGTGSTTVTTTQDLMIFSGLPPLVREGDLFKAGFTVRNTADRIMNIEALLSVTDSREKREFKPIGIDLASGRSREIGWDMVVPYGSERIVYEAKVRDLDKNVVDTIKITQKVSPAVPVRTFQATLAQVKDPFRIVVARPSDALPMKGGINLTLRPKIADGLGGVTEYMKDYPYICYEQKVSKAVALRDGAMWKSLMDELPSYLDGDGLVKYFPVWFLQGSDVLTSYVLSISHEAGYVIPDNLRQRIITGLKGFVEGRVVRWSSLPTADLSIRKIAAVEALSRYGEASHSLLDSITIEPNLWPTSALLDWINVLTRVNGIPERQARLKQAQTILRSRLNFQGTTMNLSTEKSDYCWWLMVSPDTNSVRTLATMLQFDTWNEDTPRIARAVIGRLKKGHWNTTVANAWGVLAMEKFSKKFESTPVRGTTESSLAGKTLATDWSTAPKGGESFFPWPLEKGDLLTRHKGTGRPWITVQSLAAIPLKQPVSSGFRIAKTVSAVEQKVSGKWSKGDVARVHLDIHSQTDMTWVVVNDPIPAGSTILGGGLGRDSKILTKKESEAGWGREIFRERSFEAMRAYFEYIWKGKFSVEYTVRLNNEGTFNLPPTRVEALYSPEMFGEIPNQTMMVMP